MSSRVSLNKLVEIIGGGTPKRAIKEYWNGLIPWLSVVDFNKEGRFIYETKEYITELGLQKSSTKLLETGDIIISARGTVGALGQLMKPMAFNQSCYGLRSKTDMLDQDFLYYLMKEKVAELQQKTHGAIFDTITRDTFKQIEVNLLAIQAQQKIAKILGDLDQKIEKNNQINETLEAMAQAIFKSWFVDFDPVHAKVAAKEAGLDTEAINLAAMAVISAKTPAELLSMKAESPADYETLKTTASHFPDSFEDSELGMIPKGWEIKRLSELISITGGGTPKRFKEDYWNGDIPWFSIKDLPKGIFLIDTNEKISEKGLQKSSTKLLKKGTTIITARGTVGKLALLAIDCCMNQSCYGINGKEIGDYYNYFNLKEAVATLKKNVHGAVFDTITTQTFDTYLQVFSGKNITELYEILIKNMMDKMKNNLYQNVELTELRDSLLPKLLSGEIEV